MKISLMRFLSSEIAAELVGYALLPCSQWFLQWPSCAIGNDGLDGQSSQGR